MRGNRESKVNIIFIYHLNIHILFLNLTFTCNERRRFSRDISRECWSGRGQQQQQLGRRRDDQRFSRDVRQNSERSGQNRRPNGGPQNNYRAQSNERYDRNNSTYGRPFNQERGQNSNRYSQDYRNAPPKEQRQ
jgi:hypothetical protein